MRSDLDHLPERQQRELERVRDILLAGFEAAKNGGGGGTSTWRRGGMVLKIILFGSYARTDWVDEPENGYLSDFDLLIVVNNEKLTNIADYWWNSEDQILRDPAIGRTVNLIVHDIHEVNDALRRGEYFWTTSSATASHSTKSPTIRSQRRSRCPPRTHTALRSGTMRARWPTSISG